MKASHILLAAVSVLGILGGAAHAQVDTMETTFVRVNTVEIDGTVYNVYDMMATQGSDWTNAILEITLTTGEFYNHFVASDSEPDPTLFGSFPDLEWDTYASVPGGYPTLASFTPNSQFGQAGPTGDPETEPHFPVTNTHIKAGWFDTVKRGAGTFKIARLTLSSHAAGTIDGAIFANSPSAEPYGKWFDGMYFIESGYILPEPPPPPSPPEAHAGGPYTIFLGESVTLDAGGSMDPNGDIASYRWDLDGDEAFETDAGDQFTFEATPGYLASLVGGGHHTISVLVTDGESLSDTAETLLTIMTYGDANIDGYVDDYDLAWLLSYWTGPLGTGGTWQTGDFEGDGDVSYDDLAILLANWTGPPPAGVTIPEPATLSLLALGGLAAMRRRRESTGGER